MTTPNVRRRAPLLFLLLTACLCIAASACVGAAARQTMTLPAMRAAWANIKTEATRHATRAPDFAGLTAIGEADAAMAAGTAAAIAAAPWGPVEAHATADIEERVANGEIGPGVGESLAEELRLFAESRAAFTRSPR